MIIIYNPPVFRTSVASSRTSDSPYSGSIHPSRRRGWMRRYTGNHESATKPHEWEIRGDYIFITYMNSIFHKTVFSLTSNIFLRKHCGTIWVSSEFMFCGQVIDPGRTYAITCFKNAALIILHPPPCYISVVQEQNIHSHRNFLLGSLKYDRVSFLGSSYFFGRYCDKISAKFLWEMRRWLSTVAAAAKCRYLYCELNYIFLQLQSFRDRYNIVDVYQSIFHSSEINSIIFYFEEMCKLTLNSKQTT